MAGILLAGMAAYRQLPVSALPQVDYPTIQILTFYPGASPSVMASSVTTPLERQFGQIPGLNQMTSTSSSGASLITLQFVLDLNIDIAEQQVQASINSAATFLPANLPNPPIYSKTNPADTPVITLALSSDTLPLMKLEDLADTVLSQKISQLPGVGLVSISGGQKPAVRIQANPTALASYGLSLEDLRTALAQANVNQAKGNLDGPRQAFTIWANDQLLTSDAYKPIVIAYKNGAPVRVVVPWKYGFKSAKSIVRIRLTADEPKTAWNKAAPQEYGFYSNVNPKVDHPRWSQATERRIGEFRRRETLMWNGYDQVAGLYSGMDLKKQY